MRLNTIHETGMITYKIKLNTINIKQKFGVCGIKMTIDDLTFLNCSESAVLLLQMLSNKIFPNCVYCHFIPRLDG